MGKYPRVRLTTTKIFKLDPSLYYNQAEKTGIFLITDSFSSVNLQLALQTYPFISINDVSAKSSLEHPHVSRAKGSNKLVGQ